MRDLVAQRAPELLERVTELVGEDPFARVEENTRFAQPAIFCASVVGWDALDLPPSAGAGHSLGLGFPQNSTLFYSVWLYQQGFGYFHMGYASALAWVLFLVTLAFTLVLLRGSTRWVHYQGGVR